MSFYDTQNAKRLGPGLRSPAGSLSDTELAGLLRGYRLRVASSYRALRIEQLDQLPPGLALVSPKVDGELWFLIFDGDEVALANSRASVISGPLPLLKEARGFCARAQGLTVVAGELYAAKKGGQGRPRVGDLAQALGGEGDAEVGRVAFQAFDLLRGGAGQLVSPLPDYAERLEALRLLLEGGKRVRVVRTESASGPEEVAERYSSWVSEGRAEGLVVRAATGRIFKIKPILHVDAAVIGYTTRGEDPTQVRNVLLALRREQGQFQIIGSCGNLGDEVMRRALRERLEGDHARATFRKASSDGSLYRFVRPKLVMEIRITDVQSEDSQGRSIRRMAAEWEEDEQRWRGLRRAPGLSILHPVFVRMRDDKDPSREEVRIEQLLDRCLVPDADRAIERLELPSSDVIRREVYTKTTKGALAVRKLLVWRTNKDAISADFPSFVVHWTDYSPTRKEPLKRVVKPAADEADAMALADALVKKEIKRGWKPAQG